MKFFIFILWGLLTWIHLNAQERKSSLGFSIEKPSNWIETSHAALDKNVMKLALSKDTADKIIQEASTDYFIASFMKYDVKQKAGLIPTINISARVNPTTNEKDFFLLMELIIKSTMKFFPNCKLISAPTKMVIDNVSSYSCSFSYSMPLKNGRIMFVRDRIYGIPTKKYYYLLSMIDAKNSEDCSKFFDELLKTVKIEK